MAWLESHQTLARHPKTRKAARLLGIGVPQMIGHLHLLWYWALDYAQEGDLSPYDNADIADAAMWDCDPEIFVTALVNCGVAGVGFIDGNHQLHDWMEYAGKLIVQRKADAERKRNARLKLDTPTQSSGHPADGGRTADVPYPTVPNQTNNTADKPPAVRPVPKPTSLFDQWWELYPRRLGTTRGNKGNAKAAFDKLSPQLQRTALEAVKKYARSAQAIEENGKYIPDAERWIKGARWEDNFDEVIKTSGDFPPVGYSFERDEAGQWKPMKPDPDTGLYPFGCKTRAECEDRNQEARLAFIEARDNGRAKEAIA